MPSFAADARERPPRPPIPTIPPACVRASTSTSRRRLRPADSARKIAHLEKLALIWEDEVRAPDRALAVFNEILTLEPNRRSAILGLARCAARAGNARELLRALVLEADVAGDDLFLNAGRCSFAPRTSPRNSSARPTPRSTSSSGSSPTPVAIRLRCAPPFAFTNGRAARPKPWHNSAAAQSKPQGPEQLPHPGRIARFLEERMHRTADALDRLARSPPHGRANPTPRAEIRRILLASGDYRAVAEELAHSLPPPQSCRAR
jgi:hypothetical protein